MAEAAAQQPATEQTPAVEVPSHMEIPTHPIAPRLKNGPKIPHIGPHIHAYKAAHSETVGHESDKWWARVCLLTRFSR